MNKFSKFLFASFVFLFVAAAGLAGCGPAAGTPVPGGTGPGITITITDNICPSLEARVNEQITFVNEGESEHPLRVEKPDGEPLIDLGVLQPGDSASFTFPETGTFTFTCSEEQGTTGTITIAP